MAIFNSYVKLPEGTNAVPINQGGIGSPGTGEVPPGGMAMENLWLWGDRKLGTQWGQQENMGRDRYQKKLKTDQKKIKRSKKN